jgi:hypothetical protein
VEINMVHKMDLRNVDVKAVLIIGQPTEDIKQEVPKDVPTKEVSDDFYSDLDESYGEFLDSLGGQKTKDEPLFAEKSL